MSRDKKDMILQVTELAEEGNCRKIALHDIRRKVNDLSRELTDLLSVMDRKQVMMFAMRCGDELKYESKVNKLASDVDHLESQLAQLILTQEECEILPKDRMAVLSVTKEQLLSWPRPKLDLLMAINKGRCKLYTALISADAIFCDILEDAIDVAEEVCS